MTQTLRPTQWLYIHETLPVRLSGVPDGVTVTATICAVREGTPAAIGTLSGTLTASSPGEHGVDFARSSLLSQLGAAGYVGRRVFLHLDDGVNQRDVWPFLVSNIDPDLLGPCPQN